MTDQTPQSFTDDELRHIIEHGPAWNTDIETAVDLARELLDARARISYLEAELGEYAREAGAARGSALALQARVMELQTQVTARDKRIAELESESDPDGWAVTVGDEGTGRFVQAGAVMSRVDAEGRARLYADRGARVVELREVRDAE